jgi:hypothetical protein
VQTRNPHIYTHTHVQIHTQPYPYTHKYTDEGARQCKPEINTGKEVHGGIDALRSERVLWFYEGREFYGFMKGGTEFYTRK